MARGTLPGQKPDGWTFADPLAESFREMTTEQRLLVESQVASASPSMGVAYVLWALLGLFSAHRFYLGRPASAVLQILSYLVLIGFLWLLIDAFLIPGMVRSTRDRVRRDLLARISR